MLTFPFPYRVNLFVFRGIKKRRKKGKRQEASTKGMSGWHTSLWNVSPFQFLKAVPFDRVSEGRDKRVEKGRQRNRY